MKKVLALSLYLLFAGMLFPADEPLVTVSVDTWGLIENNKMAYLDYHYLTSTLFWSEVVLLDIPTKAKTVLVPTDGTYPFYISYGFSGNHLAYLAYTGTGSGSGGGGGGGSTSSLQYKNTATGATRALSNSTAWKEMVWVGGNIVTWVDYRYQVPLTIDSVNSEIYIYNLAISQEQRLTTDHAYQGYPVTDGQRVAWIDYSASYGKLFLHTLSTGETREIAPFAAGKNNPRIAGNYVVWEDYRNLTTDPKNVDLYLYDIAADVSKPICTAPGFQGRLYINGTNVVWEDYRNASPTDSLNADVYGYNISADCEFASVVGPGYQAHPTLNGDTLCWFSHETSQMQLMMQMLDETPAIEASKARKSSRLSLRLSAEGILHIAGAEPGALVSVRVYDLAGRCVTTSSPCPGNSSGCLTVSLDRRLAKGVYALSVRAGERTYRQKAIAW
ncbi:MAG: hypothetical protein V1913_02305 [Fibrobacterota bacterium]